MPFCLSSESRYSRLYCAAYLMEGMLRTSMMQFILWNDRNLRNLLRGCMECPIVKQCNCLTTLNTKVCFKLHELHDIPSGNYTDEFAAIHNKNPSRIKIYHS